MILSSNDLVRLRDRYPGFTSFKTIGAIHYRHRWFRDALICLTLDPTVTLMWANDLGPALPGAVFSFMIMRLGTPTLVTVSTEPLALEADDLIKMDHINLFRSQLRGPAVVAGREIWRHKNYPVGTAARLLAIDKVRHAGSAVKLGQLAGSLGQSDTEAIAAVLGLAANGYLTFDIQRGLDLQLAVKLGPQALSSDSKMPDASNLSRAKEHRARKMDPETPEAFDNLDREKNPPGS